MSWFGPTGPGETHLPGFAAASALVVFLASVAASAIFSCFLIFLAALRSFVLYVFSLSTLLDRHNNLQAYLNAPVGQCQKVWGLSWSLNVRHRCVRGLA